MEKIARRFLLLLLAFLCSSSIFAIYRFPGTTALKKQPLLPFIGFWGTDSGEQIVIESSSGPQEKFGVGIRGMNLRRFTDTPPNCFSNNEVIILEMDAEKAKGSIALSPDRTIQVALRVDPSGRLEVEIELLENGAPIDNERQIFSWQSTGFWFVEKHRHHQRELFARQAYTPKHELATSCDWNVHSHYSPWGADLNCAEYLFRQGVIPTEKNLKEAIGHSDLEMIKLILDFMPPTVKSQLGPIEYPPQYERFPVNKNGSAFKFGNNDWISLKYWNEAVIELLVSRGMFFDQLEVKIFRYHSYDFIERVLDGQGFKSFPPKLRKRALSMFVGFYDGRRGNGLAALEKLLKICGDINDEGLELFAISSHLDVVKKLQQAGLNFDGVLPQLRKYIQWDEKYLEESLDTEAQTRTRTLVRLPQEKQILAYLQQ